MPVVPVSQASPYPLVSTIMDLARTRINDTANGIDGDLLTNDAPYTPSLLNAAWQWLQSKWAQGGGEPFKKEVVIADFPARIGNDITQQAYLGQNQSSDGLNVYQENYLLPSDLINPMSVWRRVGGGALQLMELAKDGLPRWFDCNVYDWRDSGGMYFYANTIPQDFLIRYQAQWPDLDLTDPLARAPIVRCENCLAARIGYEFARRLGAAGAAELQEMADTEFGTILQRTSRRENRKNLRRQPYGGRRNNGFGEPFYIR